jgi:hypothetical protein
LNFLWQRCGPLFNIAVDSADMTMLTQSEGVLSPSAKGTANYFNFSPSLCIAFPLRKFSLLARTGEGSWGF